MHLLNIPIVKDEIIDNQNDIVDFDQSDAHESILKKPINSKEVNTSIKHSTNSINESCVTINTKSVWSQFLQDIIQNPKLQASTLLKDFFEVRMVMNKRAEYYQMIVDHLTDMLASNKLSIYRFASCTPAASQSVKPVSQV